jgi:hypothetical protein
MLKNPSSAEDESIAIPDASKIEIGFEKIASDPKTKTK